MTKQSYDVLKDGFIAGNHYKTGDTIEMAPGEAKYLAEPYGNRLRLKKAAEKKPAPVKKPAEDTSSK